MPNTLGVLTTVRERLIWARRSSGLTTRELAALAKVSDGYPSAIECEQLKKPSLDALEKIAGALGVAVEWLCFGHGRKPSEASLRRRGAEMKKGLAA